MLKGPSDEVLSVGPPAGWWPASLEALSEHVPLGVSALSGLRMTLDAREADVVHAWSLGSAPAAAAAARQAARPCVLSLPCAPAGEAMRSAVNFAGFDRLHLTVPTAASRTAVLRGGAFDAQVHVLAAPAAVSADPRGDRRRVRKALGLTDEHFVVVAAAEMTRAAGHKYASWAHEIVWQLHPELRLLLPGGGPAAGSVRNFITETCALDHTHLPGDRFEPATALAASDLACFLVERDGGTAALAAALAAGLPVIAADTPDARELTDDGRAAALVPPGVPRRAAATLLELVEDASRRERLSAAAREWASRRHPLDACRAALDGIYAAAGAGAAAEAEGGRGSA